MATDEAKKRANAKYAQTTRKDKYVTLTITKDVYALIKQQAAERGLAMGNYVKLLVDEDIKNYI